MLARILMLIVLILPGLTLAEEDVAPGENENTTTTQEQAPGEGQDNAAPPKQDQEGGSDWTMFILLGGVVLFMYMIMIRPQRKEQKRRQQMIDSLTEGTKVVSIGGIHGEIVRKGEQTIDMKLADGTVMTLNRGAVHVVVNDDTPEGG